jgi:hypothetical protein
LSLSEGVRVGPRLNDPGGNHHLERGNDQARPVDVGTSGLRGPPFAVADGGTSRGAGEKKVIARGHALGSSIVQRFQFAPLRRGIFCWELVLSRVMPPRTAARRARAQGAPGALLRAREFSAASGASPRAPDTVAPAVGPGRRRGALPRGCQCDRSRAPHAWHRCTERYALEASARTPQMRQMTHVPHLRYLRRPAALRIVSSDTFV